MYEVGLIHRGTRYCTALIAANLFFLGVYEASALTSAEVSWDPSPSPAVSAYKVYYGVTTGIYTNSVSADAATTAIVPGLSEGITYFFAATALDSAGQESDYSAEVSFIPPSSTNNTGPYTPAAAQYSGLFYESNQVQLESSGSFKLTTTTKKGYSGRISLRGAGFFISGRLDDQGRGSNFISRFRQTPLILNFDCGASNISGTVVGTLTTTGWLASVSAERSVFNVRTNPAPWSGSYTLVLPGQTYDDSNPQGHGYGAVKVRKSGLTSFVGRLADGTRISQNAPLSKDGLWPFYASLYSSHGLILSWLSVTNQTVNNPDISGLATWIKLANPLQQYYPAGFTNESYAGGSIYLRPLTNTEHVVRLNNAKLRFAGGNLPQEFTNSVALGLSSKIINESTNALSMRFSLWTGIFSGQVVDPVTRKTRYFGGAILQKFESGYGMLLGTNLSSRVDFMP